jgi:hypothetical protein
MCTLSVPIFLVNHAKALMLRIIFTDNIRVFLKWIVWLIIIDYSQNISDLNTTDVSTTIDKTYTKLHLTMREHVNPLIQDPAQHLPPPKIARRSKRRHHTDNLEPTDE